MSDQEVTTTAPVAETPRGPDGKFVPAATEPAAEPPKPKARDHADFARRRATLDEKARAVAERERQVNQALQIAQQQDQERQRQIAELSKKLEAWEKGNPLAIAQAAGRNIDEAVREFVQGTTPESLAKKALEEAAALKRELQEERDRKRQQDEEYQKQAAARQRESVRHQFVAEIVKDPTRFPYLNHEFTEDLLLEYTVKFDTWAESQGKSYTFEQATSELERLAKVRYETLEARRASLFGSKPSAPAQTAGSSIGRSEASPPPARRVAAPPEVRGKPKSRQEMQRLRDEQAAQDLAILRAARLQDQKR